VAEGPDQGGPEVPPEIVAEIEALIASWDRDGDETYRELANRIAGVLRRFEVSA
jgi:hypothetical protein